MKIYFLLAFSFIISKTNAQLFSEKVDINEVFDVYSFDVGVANNSYILGLTEVQTANNFRDVISIVKTNWGAEIQSTFNYETTDTQFSISCKKITPLENGNLLVSGIYLQNNSFPYYPFIMSLDSNGNVIWAKQLNILCDTEGIYFKHLTDNSLLGIVKNNGATQYPVLFKIDNSGNISSTMKLSSSPYNVINIIPNASTFDILFSDGNLLNIENDLSIINWQKKYLHQSGINFAKTANGDFIIAAAQVFGPGYMTISRMDESGNTIWSKLIESWIGPIQNQSTIFDVVGIHFVKETTGGNIVVSANSEGGLNGTFQIILDENGNYISNYKTTYYKNKMFLLENDEFLAAGTSTIDEFNSSGLIFERRDLSTKYSCGQVLSYSITDDSQDILTSDNITLATYPPITSNNILVIKASAPASTINYCNTVLLVNDNDNSNSTINIYPNPTSSIVNIEIDSPIESIYLSDCTGRIFNQLYGKTIDLSGLPNGMYFLSIKTKDTVIQRKILKN